MTPYHLFVQSGEHFVYHLTAGRFIQISPAAYDLLDLRAHLPKETADLINETHASGGRVISVGTTSCRTLESCPVMDGQIQPDDGWTQIFIYPGYQFKVIDGLITNFHLPESTLIMLVSAFAGFDNVMNAYKVAVEERYRFFSFGDAMAIL